MLWTDPRRDVMLLKVDDPRRVALSATDRHPLYGPDGGRTIIVLQSRFGSAALFALRLSLIARRVLLSSVLHDANSRLVRLVLDDHRLDVGTCAGVSALTATQLHARRRTLACRSVLMLSGMGGQDVAVRGRRSMASTAEAITSRCCGPARVARYLPLSSSVPSGASRCRPQNVIRYVVPGRIASLVRLAPSFNDIRTFQRARPTSLLFPCRSVFDLLSVIRSWLLCLRCYHVLSASVLQSHSPHNHALLWTDPRRDVTILKVQRSLARRVVRHRSSSVMWTSAESHRWFDWLLRSTTFVLVSSRSSDEFAFPVSIGVRSAFRDLSWLPRRRRYHVSRRSVFHSMQST